MSNLVPSPSAALPIPCPPGVDRAVRYLSNKLVAVAGGHELPASEAPTPEQRQGLERRLSRLGDWLAPFSVGDGQAVRDELSALLGTRKGNVTAADAAVLLEVYVQDLRDLPFHAIQAACRDYRQGRVPGDEGFRPTQGDLRAQAQRHLREIGREQQRIRAILAAKLVEGRQSSPEHRRASAEAARAAFRLPPDGLPSGAPHRVDANAPDALAKLAAEITARSNAALARARKTVRDADHGPDERFRIEGDAA